MATGFWPAALQAANSQLRDKVAEGGGAKSVSLTECLESIECLHIYIHRDILGAYMYTHIKVQNADIHMYIYVYIHRRIYRVYCVL